MIRWIRLRMPLVLLAAAVLLLTTVGLLTAAPAMKKLTVTGTALNQKREGAIYLRTLADAAISQEDAVFTSKTLVMQSEGDVHLFTCTGNPVFTDPGARITADKVEGQSTPRIAKFIATSCFRCPRNCGAAGCARGTPSRNLRSRTI